MYINIVGGTVSGENIIHISQKLEFKRIVQYLSMKIKKILIAF